MPSYPNRVFTDRRTLLCVLNMAHNSFCIGGTLFLIVMPSLRFTETPWLTRIAFCIALYAGVFFLFYLPWKVWTLKAFLRADANLSDAYPGMNLEERKVFFDRYV